MWSGGADVPQVKGVVSEEWRAPMAFNNCALVPGGDANPGANLTNFTTLVGKTRCKRRTHRLRSGQTAASELNDLGQASRCQISERRGVATSVCCALFTCLSPMRVQSSAPPAMRLAQTTLDGRGWTVRRQTESVCTTYQTGSKRTGVTV